MILFVGTQNKGYYLQEMNITEEIVYTGFISDIQNLPEKALETDYDTIILSAEMFIARPEDIVIVINKIRNVSRANLIIFAPGYDMRSKLLSAFLKNGYTNFITSPTLSGQKLETQDCLSNKNNTLKESIMPENLEPEITITKNKVYKTVGVIGSQKRIGTTTQAIQIVKYLNFIGYKACYVELNNCRYLNLLENLYSDAISDAELNKITYSGVDMFRSDNLSNILSLGYDYYVYDFGTIDEANLISFEEKNIHILVCGSSPSEMNFSSSAIRKLYRSSNLHYIFNFVSPADYNDIKELMESRAKRTHFSLLINDAFSFLSESKTTYNTIFNLVEQTPIETSNKKWSFFRRKKG